MEKDFDCSVLSFNVWAHPFARGPECHTRLVQFISLVANLRPRVVCCQELFSSKMLVTFWTGDLNFVCDEMAKLGYTTLRSRDSVPWLYGLNSGLVSFCRDADKDAVVEFSETPFCDLTQPLTNKGFQRFVFRSGLTLVNAHFEHKGDGRLKQVRQVAQSVLENAAKGPVIVCGDFNIAQQPIWDDGACMSKWREQWLELD